jgi:long-chain fatty acid transport protein
MKPGQTPLLALLVTTLTATSAFGLGFRIPDQSAFAIGRGDAFVATADDPSAVYYNPAGITQLAATSYLVSGYGIAFNERVNLDVKGVKDFDNKWDPQAFPTTFSSMKLGNLPVWFGFGSYLPFGLRIRYADDVAFRQVAREGSIQYTTYNPVIAIQVAKTLSIAAGPTINYARAELVQGVVAKGDEFRFEGDNFSFGFNLGVLWQPTPKHSFGATYSSPTVVDFDGYTHLYVDAMKLSVPVAPGVFAPLNVPETDKRQRARARIDFPQHVTAGYSFRPTPNWNLEADVDWTDWETLDTVYIRQEDGTKLGVPFNYRSSFLYEFGATRYFGKWHLSAGYIFSQRTVPNEQFNPGVPDSDRHVFSLGIGRKYDHLSWDVAYQYIWGPERNIEQGNIVDGNYRFESHAVSLALGYHF